MLGVSVDTVRRWADGGKLAVTRSPRGERLVDAARLAAFMATTTEGETRPTASARNHLRGVVTRVVRDKVVAQVEIQVGKHRLVSVITREAADQMQLAPGVLADAVVKATSVGVELPSKL